MKKTILLILFFSMIASGPAFCIEYELEKSFPRISFNRPVDLQDPQDGTDRLFVVDQSGLIFVFANSKDATEKAVFLDIRERIPVSEGEEGLLGVAFHPKYAENGYFYVHYSAQNPRRSVIACYHVDPKDPDRAEDKEEVLLEIPQPSPNHKGGQLSFGPDGFLYLGIGDGNVKNDPVGSAQSLNSLLGKILRIDVDHSTFEQGYEIPKDNPYRNAYGTRPEIYAYGLHDPRRFSFDKETGLLWAGDTGQDRAEEIDIIEKGKNYGWNIMEGSGCAVAAARCNSAGLVKPVAEYAHSVGESVIGGFVYRGSRLPELQGSYIFGDAASGTIWALTYDGKNPPAMNEIAKINSGFSSFGRDKNNEIYICGFDGNIYRIAAKTAKP